MKLSLTMVPEVLEQFQRFFPPQALPGRLWRNRTTPLPTPGSSAQAHQSADDRLRGARAEPARADRAWPSRPQDDPPQHVILRLAPTQHAGSCALDGESAGGLGPSPKRRAGGAGFDVDDLAPQQGARLRAVAGDAGCHNCHSHQSCMTHCPVELNPTASIAGLKRLAAIAALKGEL